LINLIIIFLSFLFTVGATPYFISFLARYNIVDKPNGEDRHIHTEPIPHLGGVIVFAVIVSVTFTFYHDVYSKLFFLAGAIIIFGLGIVDDIKSINWNIKFLVQSIAVMLFIISLNEYHYPVIKFADYTLPYGLNYAVLFILILGILNSFNLMDGLDGLVTGFSLIIASMCFLLSLKSPSTFLPYFSSAIIGTTLGFLKFNANPARIFLGDSGSLTLGYLLSGMVILISVSHSLNSSIKSPDSTYSIDLAFVIIALAVPIVDTIRVMFTRLSNKKNPFLADTSHLHHILYSKNITHKTAVLLIHLFSIVFVLLAIYYVNISKTNALIIFTVLLTAFFFVRQIVEYVISKEHLLAYGKLFKKIPMLIPNIYKYFLIPLVSFALLILIILLSSGEILKGSQYNFYLLFFVSLSFIYSMTTLRKNNYYSEVLVLINIILFFIITGANDLFYKAYPVPVLIQINFNQVFIGVLSFIIIFFILFKERIASVLENFFMGTDLTIAVLILFIYIAVQFLNIPDSYKISDTLLRGFLVFIFYKIIIIVKPRFHSFLFYGSFAITIFVVLVSLF
jgi:UDP-GlcNAc:undecaprenyl-phosphate GlcNAc-1-phosphate transferase